MEVFDGVVGHVSSSNKKLKKKSGFVKPYWKDKANNKYFKENKCNEIKGECAWNISPIFCEEDH